MFPETIDNSLAIQATLGQQFLTTGMFNEAVGQAEVENIWAVAL